MDEKQRCELAKEYAQKNEAKSFRKHPTRKGRMYEMRKEGKVGHPNRKKQLNYARPWMDDVWQIPGPIWKATQTPEKWIFFLNSR
jgi:hypothetical protein